MIVHPIGMMRANAAATGLTLALESYTPIGSVFNTTKTQTGIATSDGDYHLVVIFHNDDTSVGVPTSVSLGGVSCTLLNDGTSDAKYTNITTGSWAIYKTASAVTGTSNSLVFTVTAYYSAFDVFVISCSDQPALAANLVFNATTAQNPVSLNINVVEGGAVLVAGAHNGVPTTLTPTGVSLMSTVGDVIHSPKGLVLAAASDVAAASPRTVSMGHDLGSQLSYIAISLEVA